MAARVPERVPERADDLFAELRGLSPRVRGEILDSLSPSERAQAAALIEEDRRASDDLAPPPASSIAYSPWLAARLRDARDNGNADPNMTAATRRVLLQSAEALAADTRAGSPDGPPGDPEPARSRSLLGVLGGLLSPARPAR